MQIQGLLWNVARKVQQQDKWYNATTMDCFVQPKFGWSYN